jgi:hypothetical protein
MILGMSVAAYTTLHVLISLLALAPDWPSSSRCCAAVSHRA